MKKRTSKRTQKAADVLRGNPDPRLQQLDPKAWAEIARLDAVAAAKADVQGGWDEAYVGLSMALRDLEQTRAGIGRLLAEVTELAKRADAHVLVLRERVQTAKAGFDRAENAWGEAETASRELRAQYGLGYRDDGVRYDHAPEKAEVQP